MSLPHNAAKHSQTRHFKLQMRNASSELHLAIADSGVGFDPVSATNRQGPGPVSMQERAKLAHETIVIDSKPMGGTTIHVHMPFSSKKIRKASTRQVTSDVVCI